MIKNDSKQNKMASFGGIVVLVVALATIVIFYGCSPAPASANYWIAMADIVAMEFTLGGQAIFALFGVKGLGGTEAAPPAISISRTTTIGLFFAIGVPVSIWFAIQASNHSYDISFRVILTVKWVALLIIMTGMWAIGMEDSSTVAVREESRIGRLRINDRLHDAFLHLRGASVVAEAKPLWQSTLDEFEATNNRVRSWVSARPDNQETNAKIDVLVDQLVRLVADASQAPSGENSAFLREIGDTIQNIAREVRGSSTSKVGTALRLN